VNLNGALYLETIEWDRYYKQTEAKLDIEARQYVSLSAGSVCRCATIGIMPNLCYKKKWNALTGPAKKYRLLSFKNTLPTVGGWVGGGILFEIRVSERPTFYSA
jgi:hypothetical protein